LAKKRQALIEFVELNSAMKCIYESNYFNQGIRIGKSIAYFDYSNNYQTLKNKPDELYSSLIIITVSNVIYPITVNVIQTICSPFGQIKKIDILKKTNQPSFLVKFESIETAVKARSALDGADIYEDCCTLKVKFSKVSLSFFLLKFLKFEIFLIR
jgi:heterogeneous nuclear ribonucleoprotein L